jgi:glutathione S-transferase
MQVRNPSFLYTFRRCPYAMRARLALCLAGINVRVREIDLKHKHPEFIATSAKGTVPVLVFEDGSVLDESLDIVDYVCAQDGGAFLCMPDTLQTSFSSLHECFKLECLPAIYRYKYPDRYDNVDIDHERDRIQVFFSDLEDILIRNPDLVQCFSILDVIFMPFVRQISLVNPQWFEDSVSELVQSKLKFFLDSEAFATIMVKRQVWSEADDEVYLL